MKREIAVRINVLAPPKGVAMMVQRGKNELTRHIRDEESDLTFEFLMDVDTSGSVPNFLGEYAQGPRDSRFIYVNSGGYAGQASGSWSRRAKISLMSITSKQVDDVLADSSLLLETSFPGTDAKGGPTCATVKGIDWRVAKR